MLWQDDITTIKQVVNDCETYETLMNCFKKSPILYIDDFFKTRTGNTVSPADINATFKIVNYRYNENLPTIISSELSIHEISEIDTLTCSQPPPLLHITEPYLLPSLNISPIPPSAVVLSINRFAVFRNSSFVFIPLPP